jgi:hypothetical protein
MSAPATVGGAHALWYATRGTGVVSLILLTAIVCLGIAGTRRLYSERWPRFVVAGLHRNLTLVALVFLALHIATTVLDGYAPIGLADAVIPFAAGYRPLWLGLGAVAFDLLLAITITSLLRLRLEFRVWRALHWTAYAAWPIALVHALGTGSDARIGWMQALGLFVTAAVVLAVAARLVDGTDWGGRRYLAAGTLVLAPLAGAAWYETGPAQVGWAARAGTPSTPSLRAAAVAHTRTGAELQSGALASLPPAPFTASLRGTVRTTQRSDGLVLVDIRGRTRRPANGVLWIRLEGRASSGGGVAMTASGASYGPPSAPAEYVGKISSLRGTKLVLALRGPRDAIAVRVHLRIDNVSHRVTGTLAAASRSGAKP